MLLIPIRCRTAVACSTLHVPLGLLMQELGPLLGISLGAGLAVLMAAQGSYLGSSLLSGGASLQFFS